MTSEGTAPPSLPRHVAIIMDGNGRWASLRGLPRIEGHRMGVRSVRAVVECARELRIPCLTLYAFSLENWGRPEPEVLALMTLLKEFLVSERSLLRRHRIRLRVIGEISSLPSPVRRVLERTVSSTAKNTGMTLTLGLSYAGRNEIVRAARRLAAEAAARVPLHLRALVVVPGEGHRLEGEGHAALDEPPDAGEALLEGARHPRHALVGLLRHPVEADLDLLRRVLGE